MRFLEEAIEQAVLIDFAHAFEVEHLLKVGERAIADEVDVGVDEICSPTIVVGRASLDPTGARTTRSSVSIRSLSRCTYRTCEAPASKAPFVPPRELAPNATDSPRWHSCCRPVRRPVLHIVPRQLDQTLLELGCISQ